MTRANGLTHAMSVPSGGLVSGTSSLIRLDGWTWEDLTARTPVALHVRWPSFRIRRNKRPDTPSPADQKKQREERLERLDDLLSDARAYSVARSATDAGARPVEVDPRLEAMLPVLDGSLPIVVHADEVQQLRSAIEWSEKQKLRIVIAGSGDVGRIADVLARKQIPVIVTSVLALPAHEDDPYDAAYTLPLALQRAGVQFCIATSGTRFQAPMTFGLPYHAAMAAAFGLNRDEAFRAVTLYPAEILGVDDVLGSIEVGKSASLILTDGDPLEIRTGIQMQFIDGRPVELKANRHDRLYEKYRRRPAPMRGAAPPRRGVAAPRRYTASLRNGTVCDHGFEPGQVGHDPLVAGVDLGAPTIGRNRLFPATAQLQRHAQVVLHVGHLEPDRRGPLEGRNGIVDPLGAHQRQPEHVVHVTVLRVAGQAGLQ